MEDLEAQVHTLKDELERVYRKVDRMEETVAELQHFLEESRRVARGNDGNHDGDEEGCRNSSGDGVQHGGYEGRIAELHRHITELEEDNRSLREAREGKVSEREAQVCCEEVHELLTPAVKAQRHQAIQLLSGRIKLLMDLLRSALDQGDASRSDDRSSEE